MKVISSRRFWVFVLSQLVTITLFAASTFITDLNMLKLAQMIVSLVEGVGIFVVVAYTVDDVTSNVMAIRAGTHPNYQPRINK